MFMAVFISYFSTSMAACFTYVHLCKIFGKKYECSLASFCYVYIVEVQVRPDRPSKNTYATAGGERR